MAAPKQAKKAALKYSSCLMLGITAHLRNQYLGCNHPLLVGGKSKALLQIIRGEVMVVGDFRTEALLSCAV